MIRPPPRSTLFPYRRSSDLKPRSIGFVNGTPRLVRRIEKLPNRCAERGVDRKSTRLNSSHVRISYAVFCLKKKKKNTITPKLNTHKKQSDQIKCTTMNLQEH